LLLKFANNHFQISLNFCTEVMKTVGSCHHL